VAAEKNMCGRFFILFFTESYLVGARKKYAQTPSTVVLYNIFNAITLSIDITIKCWAHKTQAHLNECV
jgi:hypothetical protein